MLLAGMDFARLARQAAMKTDPDLIGVCRFPDARLVAHEDGYGAANLFGLNQNIRPRQRTVVPALV
jgi:hypothetical protein